MFGRRHRQRPRPPRPPSLPAPPPEEVLVGRSPSPFTASDLARKKRNNAAARLVDDDTYSYVILRLMKGDENLGAIEFEAHIEQQWRPAFKRVLEKVLAHGFD